MRLDKFVAKALLIPRSLAKKIIKSGQIAVDGSQCYEPGLIIAEQVVTHRKKALSLSGLQYIALNKPAGYICSTKDELYPSALQLISPLKSINLHFAGRLDQDTTGLVLISDDGQWTHRITSPRKACVKTYRVDLKEPIEQAAINQLQQGVLLHQEKQLTKPARVIQNSPQAITLSIQEGKYHQVKRMLASVGNQVVTLKRLSIGTVDLTGLVEGHWRHLTQKEIDSF